MHFSELLSPPSSIPGLKGKPSYCEMLFCRCRGELPQGEEALNNLDLITIRAFFSISQFLGSQMANSWGYYERSRLSLIFLKWSP